MELKSKIREVMDFPKEGIGFKDITTLLQDGEAFAASIDQMLEAVEDLDYNIIVGPEARGFIMGCPMAVQSKKGFVPVRKPGKLPAETVSFEYELEYGTDTVQIHKDAIKPGDKVIIADDLLATGGTAKAVCQLIESLGGEVVGLAFLIELSFLNGREILEGYNVRSVVKYD